MRNSELLRGLLVTYQGAPYVVVKPDAVNMALIYPGDDLPAGSQDLRHRGGWVFSFNLEPR
jgi:hypothetical protein